jgi:hypothetical protein
MNKNNQPETLKEALKLTTGSEETPTPEFTELDEKRRKRYKALWEWENIVEALNKQRDPNYIADCADGKRKYEPLVWLKKDDTKPTGFGFSHTLYGSTHTGTYVGSRLQFISTEDLYYALSQFEQTYIATLIY